MSTDKVEKDASVDTYDAHIVPAETAARKEREGGAYKETPSQIEDGEIDTSGGYTVDKEGLVNNFAVEPEMYIDQPGDLREKEAALAAERAQEMAEINQTDETGKLSEGGDSRGKGTGVI